MSQVAPLSRDERLMLDRIAAGAERLVARAIDWANVPSGSHDLEGLERQAQALEMALKALPGDFKRLALPASKRIDAKGDAQAVAHGEALLLTVRPHAPAQVLLTGHYDTVFPAGSPFNTVTRSPDGALHGPGIADMKGGISVMLGALEAVEGHPDAANLGYRVLLSPDEEIGSPASTALLAELAPGAALGMTYEPAMADGTLASSRKGSANFHICVQGRAAHAGRDFASGRNAIAGAARLAAGLDALNGRRAGLTVNIAALDGGGPLNVVPDRAVLRFNVRLEQPADMAWIERRLGRLSADLEALGLVVQVHGGLGRPPKPMDAAQTGLFNAVRGLARLDGLDLTWRPSGGVCEGNNLHAAGLPNIDTLGVVGGGIHSVEEYAWPDSFAQRARLSALILARTATGTLDLPRLRRHKTSQPVSELRGETHDQQDSSRPAH